MQNGDLVTQSLMNLDISMPYESYRHSKQAGRSSHINIIMILLFANQTLRNVHDDCSLVNALWDSYVSSKIYLATSYRAA